MDYSKFQVEDFVADAYFIKWVKSPEEGHIAYWSAFLSKHPECNDRVAEARQIILLLDFQYEVLPDEKFIELWEKISREDSLAATTTLRAESNTIKKNAYSWIYKIAASLLIVFACALGYYKHLNRTITIITDYGESRSLFLPDNTKVTLNSNSTVQYSPSSFRKGEREVFLTGEAFFAVTHTIDDLNFKVHTDQLEVEVLGTRFNVNSRHGKTQVVLQEGKVKLDMTDINSEPILMKPGELVEFAENDSAPQMKIVDADNYSAWKNNQLVFSGTSLLKIAQLLEDNYGYTVIFENPEMEKRNFTGTSSSENLEELFEKLSIVFDMEIKRDKKTVTINYKEKTPKQHAPS